MEITQQIAVFLDNRPGTLARVCDALAEAEINIYAISTSDTVDHSVVRMILSDPQKALMIFEERGALAVEDEVILIDDDNRPGRLAEIARTLRNAKVNIEYLYCATSPRSKKGLLVLRVNKVKKALKALGNS